MFTFSTPRSKRDPKKDAKWVRKWSQNGAKISKREPRANFGCYESIGYKNAPKKSRGSLRDGPRRPGSRTLVPLIKGKHKPESLIKRVRDREGIIRRPLVPEGRVAHTCPVSVISGDLPCLTSRHLAYLNRRRLLCHNRAHPLRLSATLASSLRRKLAKWKARRT